MSHTVPHPYRNLGNIAATALSGTQITAPKVPHAAKGGTCKVGLHCVGVHTHTGRQTDRHLQPIGAELI